MAWERPPPEVVLADQLMSEHGAACPDCGQQFDPFEVRDAGGIPDHDCEDDVLEHDDER